MKTLEYLLLKAIFFFVCLKLQSQTLTCQYNCPKVGEIFSTKTSSPVAHTSGLNQVWNFTQAQAVSTGVSPITYVDPSSVPSSSLFPQSNVARHLWGNYSFLEAEATGLKVISPNTVSVNAHSVLLPLPFSYGSTHTETIITTYLSGADTIQVTAAKSLLGAGTGTLMLPTHTYADVLRISGKTVQSQTRNGSPEGYIYTTHFNYYYSEKISHPLLYSEQKYENGPGDYAPFTQFVSAILTKQEDQDRADLADFLIIPNPASDRVKIANLKNEAVEITLYNSAGEAILTKSFSTGNKELDINSLPNGLYTLLIRQEEKIRCEKLVIVR